MTVWLNTGHGIKRMDDLLPWLNENRVLTGEPAFCVNQTISMADFIRLEPGSILQIDASTTHAGRIFGPNAELRWALRGREFDVWVIRETPEGSHDLGPLSHREVRYYCLGKWKPGGEPGTGEFKEGYLSVVPKYPSVSAREDDRVYVNVVEYFPAPIYFAAQENKTSANERILEMVAVLNLPRVIGSRFCGVDAGRTSDAL